MKERLKSILMFVKVYDIEAHVVVEALDSSWKDYEDAVQFQSAVSIYADCIVTRVVNRQLNAFPSEEKLRER